MNIATQLIKNTELGDGVGSNISGPLSDAQIQQNFRILAQEIDNAITLSGQSRNSGDLTQLSKAIGLIRLPIYNFNGVI